LNGAAIASYSSRLVNHRNAILKNSITLQKCKNINIICASQSFRFSEVDNVKASLFTMSKPVIDRAKGLKLACFCFYYTKLSGKIVLAKFLDMFNKAGLSVWNNQWSEFNDFTNDKQNVSYFDVLQDHDFISKFKAAFKDQESEVFQYFPVLYTAGLSYPQTLGSEVIFYLKV
jgi:hypothetical protein